MFEEQIDCTGFKHAIFIGNIEFHCNDIDQIINEKKQVLDYFQKQNRDVFFGIDNDTKE